MLAPMMIERLEHQTAFELPHQLRADLLLAQSPCLFRDLEHPLMDRRIVELGIGFHPFINRHLQLIFGGERRLEAGNIPLLLDRLRGDIALDGRIRFAADHVGDRFGNVVALEQFVALLIDDPPLIVGDIIVFEQLLADVEVTRF